MLHRMREAGISKKRIDQENIIFTKHRPRKLIFISDSVAVSNPISHIVLFDSNALSIQSVFLPQRFDHGR
jgi:hypothetical protein